jgi:hypothetical protein
MKTITYKRASTLDELEQIRTLQLQNSPQNITSEEKFQEGFVTVLAYRCIIRTNEFSLRTYYCQRRQYGRRLCLSDAFWP